MQFSNDLHVHGRRAGLDLHEFAAAILDGSKRVEFRKTPLAADISTVIIYATKPVGAVLGEFVVEEQAVGKPEELWVRFAEVAGIDRDGFFDYYDGAGQAVGIVIGRVRRYDQPRRLDDILDAISDAFATGTLFLGVRGAGKTVMLNAVEYLARARGWLTVSIEAPASSP